MIVGCPKETKNHEYRVGLTPTGAHALAAAGHRVLVECQAGARIGYADAAYRQAGAVLVDDAAAVYGEAELIVKVKELQPAEYPLARSGQILFCYHHFAPAPDLLAAMLASGATCLAYETVADPVGGLPLLAPMSRIAGRLAPQAGAWALQTANGGAGILLGGVPGVPPARVVVIGAGSVGSEAARIAVGMGADVLVLDQGTRRLEALDALYRGRLRTGIAEPLALAEAVAGADLVIGATLSPGRLAPKLIGQELLQRMRPGSVIVDVSIDQGGISAASRPTSHTDPLFEAEGVLHYCVPNMPSAVARTATQALTLATLPHVLALAELGLDRALDRDPGLAAGLQVRSGRITLESLARDTALPR
jgi:alanine dehydrogenase